MPNGSCSHSSARPAVGTVPRPGYCHPRSPCPSPPRPDTLTCPAPLTPPVSCSVLTGATRVVVGAMALVVVSAAGTQLDLASPGLLSAQDRVGAAACPWGGEIDWPRPPDRSASTRAGAGVAARLQTPRPSDVLERHLLSDPHGDYPIRSVRAGDGRTPSSQQRLARPSGASPAGERPDRGVHRDFKRGQQGDR
jgi:hypothetical protein